MLAVARRYGPVMTQAPADVRLRSATEDDVDFLTDVVVAATRAQGRWPADADEDEWRTGFAEWTREQVRGEVPGSTTSVIEVGGLPAGRHRVVRTDEHVELAGLQLRPEFQGRGIGSAPGGCPDRGGPVDRDAAAALGRARQPPRPLLLRTARLRARG